MDAFPSKRKRSIHERNFAERQNPTRGRTALESSRIRRACIRFADNLEYLAQATKHRTMQWMEVADVITDRDDDAIQDWRGVAENFKANGYECDDAGLLVQMQDVGLKASNKIEAVTTYVDYADGEHVHDYMIRKTIFSPFDCPTWGRLPLTLSQWRIVALAFIESRARWQWEDAVNLYAARSGIDLFNRFEYQRTVGWNMVPPSKLHQDQDAHLWTGHIIYTLAATTSLKPITDNTGSLA